jgi:hypothetical protein
MEEAHGGMRHCPQMSLSTAEQHRKNAQDCEEQAKRSGTSEHVVEEYKKLARQWRLMAEHAERDDF